MRPTLTSSRPTAWVLTRKALRNSRKKTNKRCSKSISSWVFQCANVGVKELDTGLALPTQWNLAADAKLASEHALQVARCTKIIDEGNPKEMKYVINIKQMAKFVVALDEKVATTDVEEGMRVGVDRQKYKIQLPLPPRIDPTVTMMTV
jgi:26S proteasome regulatory subunit T1